MHFSTKRSTNIVNIFHEVMVFLILFILATAQPVFSLFYVKVNVMCKIERFKFRENHYRDEIPGQRK